MLLSVEILKILYCRWGIKSFIRLYNGMGNRIPWFWNFLSNLFFLGDFFAFYRLSSFILLEKWFWLLIEILARELEIYLIFPSFIRLSLSGNCVLWIFINLKQFLWLEKNSFSQNFGLKFLNSQLLKWKLWKPH